MGNRDAGYGTGRFNPRARVGRDNCAHPDWRGVDPFQSTRPRGARPPNDFIELGNSSVSIHAPAWGATRLTAQRVAVVDVSIHAPAWGATGVKRRVCDGVGFQSTRPRGARRRCRKWRLLRWLVSIHAPAWGATIFDVRVAPPFPVSIHAPAWGATGGELHGMTANTCFNPRARVGRDGHRIAEQSG